MKSNYTLSFYDGEEIKGVKFPSQFESLKGAAKWANSKKLPLSILRVSEWDEEENCESLGNLDALILELEENNRK